MFAKITAAGFDANLDYTQFAIVHQKFFPFIRMYGRIVCKLQQEQQPGELPSG
jgi:hypothetical protein